jgi:hypothetical protein
MKNIFISLFLVLMAFACKTKLENPVEVVPPVVTFDSTNVGTTVGLDSVRLRFWGTVVSGGNLEVSERGAIYSMTAPEPTLDNGALVRTATTKGVGAYNFLVPGLRGGGMVYIRGYAKNYKGVVYTEVKSLALPNTMPQLTFPAIPAANAGITFIAKLTATMDALGGSAVIDQGFVYVAAPTANPTLETGTKVQAGNFSLGEFSSDSIKGLMPGVRYNIRAFATNAVGTGYSIQRFITTASTTPTVDISAIPDADISDTSLVKLAGTLVATGGANVTAKGFVFDTLAVPTITRGRNISVTPIAVGPFMSGVIGGLKPAKRYFVRAYATNARGTAYSEELNFETKP